MTISETTKWKVAQHVYAREFDGDLVLLDLGRGQYYGLEPIGAQLWRALEMGRTVAEVVAELEPEYDVSPETLRSDLLQLLRDLAGKGLVEPT